MNHLKTVVQDVSNSSGHRGLHLKYKGQTKPLKDWAKQLNVNPETIRRRLKRGETVREALS
jgi:IS30 family transposase